MTGEEASARLREISEGIRRAREMNIVELIPDLEKERKEIMEKFVKCVS